MEVSSHAVDQDRIKGVEFAGGIFTNLTHEHLDYHLTMDKYLEAKKKFFDLLPPFSFALINKDDEHWQAISKDISAKVSSYSLNQEADFIAKILEMNLSGTKILIDNKEIKSNLVGLFNVYNLLAVYGAADLLGMPKEKIFNLLSKLEPVRGRLELVRGGSVLGIIDYAHTPDALKKVLETLNDLKTSGQKIVCVVGAGGDRDRTKRPVMAKLASDLAQIVILTSDNPRSEDPLEIIKEMRQGIKAEDASEIYEISDRKEAIFKAVSLAGIDGVVILLGKGHETYQEIAGKRYPFDDKQVPEEAMSRSSL
ncbi:MAG: UDP-N-acetylmuramoyl-L-alanyl-D-glutamate-2,6-diaminopimelate ligase [Candidatus Nomurabacteria bacterium GW2011_GWB1_37_5]|uniref:UDP-N-acetylmuramoyl-L-alanyl-D-glutamate-2, 6-diaminopimelate ligase n=1 Tax=Candidatus Nomurabacteria bacterium GW2011_GWB1_37_5 TaxID=1618742 RepID=A0A0G0H6E6_9BACT|nr:MAG: UDP-N-acetylmuramoyl-L-alanyl-D-glutamate-2,6-diaminopimelate ligase [Candidatus Nomurabacteria bacterium GW2011_GWB1_37_5]